MEQIVYCQEQVYRRALKEVKEKEAEEEENNFNFQCNSQAPQENLSTTEMSQHPNVYYEVSVGMAQSRTSRLLPLLQCSFLCRSMCVKYPSANS